MISMKDMVLVLLTRKFWISLPIYFIAFASYDAIARWMGLNVSKTGPHFITMYAYLWSLYDMYRAQSSKSTNSSAQ